MTLRALVLALWLGGCGSAAPRSAAPAPPPTPPVSTVPPAPPIAAPPASESPPDSEITALDRDPAEVAHRVAELAQKLAAELRLPTNSTSPLHYIEGHVDVSDDAHPGSTTLSAQQAIAAAQRWHALLVDPKRDPPRCMPTSSNRQVGCLQFNRRPLVFLRFCVGERWRLASVVITSDNQRVRREFTAMRDDTTACP